MTADHRRTEATYWNHNTAYHGWVLRHLGSCGGDVLDVGCGDGLLAERLAPFVRSVVGLECDPRSAERAEARLRGLERARVVRGEFLSEPLADASFDGVIFVASLHHMDTAAALAKARRLLRPGGRLLIVGLARNRSPADWAFAAASLPAVKLASWLHREVPDPGFAIREPAESLDEIRRQADAAIPGASLRRALYFRYLLRWVAPLG